MQSQFIPIPKCLFSNQSCKRFCIHPDCKLYPFLCDHCQHSQCSNLHLHQYIDNTHLKLWSELSRMINRNLHKEPKNDQIIEIIQSIKNKNYVVITGGSMQLLYKYLNIQNGCKYIRIPLRQQYQQQLSEVIEMEQEINQKSQISDIEIDQTIELDQPLNEFYKIIQQSRQNNPLYNEQFDIHQEDTNLSDLNRTIQCNPLCINAYYNRAQFYQKKKDFRMAIYDYTEIIQLDSKSLQAYRKRALLYEKLNQFYLAMEDWKKINSYYSDQKPHYRFGLLNFKLKNYLIAQDDLQKSIEIEDATRSYYYLGLLQIRKRNFNLALSYVDYFKYLDIEFDRQRYCYQSAIQECLSGIEINETHIEMNKPLLRLKQMYTLSTSQMLF